jgi:hypothetical protein
MRVLAAFLIVCLAVAAAQVISDVPDTNPAISTTPVVRLNDHGKCKVRPQTALQIQKMRDGAKKMAAMVQKEVLVAAKRRAYVEQMTNYINDRIRELNKVKAELKEEIQWIETTNHRISAVAQQEKIARYQDISKCLEHQSGELEIKHGQGNDVMKQMHKKLQRATKKLGSIKNKIARSSN